MRYNLVLGLMTFGIMLIACRKHVTNPGIPASPVPVKKILLKDIEIQSLPSPYYHFEYGINNMVSKAGFSSGLMNYDILYSDNKIGEIRNNIIVNHDTLRYLYDNTGKLFLIKFINQENVLYRHVTFTYNGNQVREIEWDHKEGNTGFLIDRTLTFTYYPDGNVKTITEHRPASNGSPAYSATRKFEQYDDKSNVDDFSLIHDGINDHLFLLQGFRLQINNPLKETFSVNEGAMAYTIDYSYVYNNDTAPSSKLSDLLFISGPDAGKRFQTRTNYSYY